MSTSVHNPVFQPKRNELTMKTTMLYSLLFLTMLGVGIGCKKDVVEQKPPVVVSPPTSTTTPPSATTAAALPTTDVASLTAIIPPVLTLPNCRIVRETYKEGEAKTMPNPEVILVDGKKLTVYQLTVTNYKYDQQGRVIRLWQEAPSDYDRNFIYKDNLLRIINRFTQQDKQINIQQDSILLNEKGLKKYRSNGVSSLERLYDSEGYFIGYKEETRPEVLVKNRNYTQFWDYTEGVQTGVYEYDLTRPGLPNKYAYLGKSWPAVNLEVKYTLSSKGSELYRDGPLYVIYTYYKYDQFGRISCRIRYSKDEARSGYPYRQDGGGIGVTYYEYECP